MTIREAAKQANILSSKIHYAIRHGYLIATKMGGRWFIEPEDLKTYLAENPGRERPSWSSMFDGRM